MREREKRAGGARLRVAAVLGAAAMLASAASIGALSGEAAASGAGCHAPLLEGLTYKLARVIVERAGCKIRVKGNGVTKARVQTVTRQTPAAGAVASSVTVWLDRACPKGETHTPEIHEPHVTAGPTKLVSGFYVTSGKPPRYFSAAKCPRHPEPSPAAGAVEVLDATGAVVATQTSVAGQFDEIPLPPGSYTIRGTFLDTTINGVHPVKSESVVIPAGHTVRQDFILSVP